MAGSQSVLKELLSSPLVIFYLGFTVVSGLADVVQVAWAWKEMKKKREEEMKKRHVQEFLYEQAKK